VTSPFTSPLFFTSAKRMGEGKNSMRSGLTYPKSSASGFKMPTVSRNLVIGVIFIIALCAFELFNFDTTEYALQSLLGSASFLSIGWATILAIAFCAIDFAGLARIFTPEEGRNEPKEVWYLTGAWLLGATMNAVMTWWAVSLTLLSHDFGNEVLSRDQLLRFVPIFVAVLVWLTRIMFIGSMSIAGDHLFDFGRKPQTQTQSRTTAQPAQIAKSPTQAKPPALKQPATPVAQSYSNPATQTSAARRPTNSSRPPTAMQTQSQGRNVRSRGYDF
jgi:hypothetical protein